MEMRSKREAEGARIQRELAKNALPDSRFQFDLDCFIPSFKGNEEATRIATATGLFESANMVFVTPDNALRNFRTELIRANKTFLIPTYGLVRGFLLMEPNEASRNVAELASTLDGIDHFARPVTLDEISQLGECDFVAAGTSAVSTSGVRFGMGDFYLDAEMMVLDAVGFTSPATTVVTIVHDCQVSSESLDVTPGHVRVATAFTPSAALDLCHVNELRAPGRPIIPSPLCDALIFKEMREFDR